MDETKTLSECGLSSSIAKAQCPATIGLALRYFLNINMFHTAVNSIGAHLLAPSIGHASACSHT